MIIVNKFFLQHLALNSIQFVPNGLHIAFNGHHIAFNGVPIAFKGHHIAFNGCLVLK